MKKMTLTAASFVAKPTSVSEWYSLSVLSEAHSSLWIKISPHLLIKFNNYYYIYMIWQMLVLNAKNWRKITD